VKQKEEYEPKRLFYKRDDINNIRHCSQSSFACKFCDYYLTGAWSAKSWSWLVIATSPLPPPTANGAGYRTSRWRPTAYRIRTGTPSLQHLYLLHPHRHPTCWSASQRSLTVSSTLGHGVWTPAPLMFTECKCTASQIETPICPLRKTTNHLNWQ